MVVAVPALVAVMIGIMALLMYLALILWQKLLGAVFSKVPFIGGWIAGNIDAAFQDALNFLSTLLSEATRDAGWLVTSVANYAWRWINATEAAMINALHVATSALGLAEQAVGAVAGAAAGVLSEAENFTKVEIAGVVSGVEHGLADITNAMYIIAGQLRSAIAVAETAAEADASHLVAALDGVLAGELAALSSRLAAVEAALLGDVASVVSQVKADLVTAIATAENDAEAALAAANAAANTIAAAIAGTAIGALDTAAHDLVIGPWLALLPELRTLADGLDQAVAGALGLPGIIAQDIPDSIPGILAMVVPAIAAVITEVDSCLVPNCSAVNALGGLLNTLTDDAAIGLILALLVEAASDPAGAVTDITDTYGAVVNGAATAMRQLIGV